MHWDTEEVEEETPQTHLQGLKGNKENHQILSSGSNKARQNQMHSKYVYNKILETLLTKHGTPSLVNNI